MSVENEFPKNEVEVYKKCIEILNSGDYSSALKCAKDFFTKYPKSLLAKHCYGAFCGDCCDIKEHSKNDEKQCLEIAKETTKELFFNEEAKQYPVFYMHVRNEYYWFHKMHKEQYKLGLERLKINDKSGSYSACVGSSMLALKENNSGSISESEKWADESIKYFFIFEEYAPDWHNINYFASQSYACLGKYEKAKEVYKDMYRKQGVDSVNKKEYNEFLDRIKLIKMKRRD